MTPLAGLMAVKVGAPSRTVNTTALLVPPPVVTVKLRGPRVASGAIENVALSAFGAETLTLLTVIPSIAPMLVAPVTKFVPAIVTLTLEPCAPIDGVLLVSVGTGGRIVSWKGAVVPPNVVMVRLRK